MRSRKLRSGGDTKPRRHQGSSPFTKGTRRPSFSPNSGARRWPGSCTGGNTNGAPRSGRMVQCTPGEARAIRATTPQSWACSVSVDFRKRRRAGTWAKRSRTVTVVPRLRDTGVTSLMMPNSARRRCPAPSASALSRSKRLTLAMLGRASPRNPNVPRCPRSSAVRTLLVAWRSRARYRSSRAMPEPSSATSSSRLPPSSQATSRRRAPASRAFSTSSFRTEEGRSTTSPAAI